MTPPGFASKTRGMGEPKASFGFRDVEPGDKPGLVRGVFDRVAPRYDLMNDLMSAGVHRVWKDMTAARLNPQPGELIVDCAGGTGDIARRLARLARRARSRRGGPDVRIAVMGRENSRQRNRPPGFSTRRASARARGMSVTLRRPKAMT